MNLRAKIVVAAVAVLLAGCQQLPSYFNSDTTLARAGGKTLQLRDVGAVVPIGVTGDDSAAYMKVYVDRWVRKQLKLQEAEMLFSSSEEDIDRMVEEYRQVLLIRKLEQSCVDRSVDTLFTDVEIETYYNDHIADFKLDHVLVKGYIVQVPEDSRQARKLREAMASDSEEAQRTVRDICEKNGFAVTDYRSGWVDFSDFLNALPAVRSRSHESLLTTDRVQELSDGRSFFYYFRLNAVRREGENIPLELLQGTIRRVLFNQRQGEIIRSHEEELYNKALEAGEIKIYDNN